MEGEAPSVCRARYGLEGVHPLAGDQACRLGAQAAFAERDGSESRTDGMRDFGCREVAFRTYQHDYILSAAIVVGRITPSCSDLGTDRIVHIGDEPGCLLRCLGYYGAKRYIDADGGQESFERLLHRTHGHTLQTFGFDTSPLGVFRLDEDDFINSYFDQFLQHPLHSFALLGGCDGDSDASSPGFLPGFTPEQPHTAALAVGSFDDSFVERASPVGQAQVVAHLHTQHAQDVSGLIVGQSVGQFYIGSIEQREGHNYTFLPFFCAKSSHSYEKWPINMAWQADPTNGFSSKFPTFAPTLIIGIVIMKKQILAGAAIILSAALTACNGNKAQTEETETQQTETVAADLFSADSAYAYVQRQVDFGPRIPGTDAHKACGDWLAATLRSYGATVLEQRAEVKAYTGEMLPMRNIIASYNPEASQRILLMAHWDTRPFSDEDPNSAMHTKTFDGADDGGSGVGVLLEIARTLGQRDSIGIGVDLVLFDTEDYGTSGNDDSWCLGSQYWSKNPLPAGYKATAGILLDMVGSKGATFYWEYFSKRYAPGILSEVWQLAAEMGYGSYYIQADGGALTDDHLPVIRNLGIPCINIVNYSPKNKHGFGDYWHTQNDNMDNIDKATLDAVGETLLRYLDKRATASVQ